MIKVNYDATTGQILGFYPDDIVYANIPEPNIEITTEQHIDCINNQDKRKVDLETKKIISFEPTIPEQTPVEHEQVDPVILDMAETMAALNERIAKLEGGK